MEQKLLQEKQLLARRLEDIEADLMEKEVSYMQSNRQYFSLTSTPNKPPKREGSDDGGVVEEETEGGSDGVVIEEKEGSSVVMAEKHIGLGTEVLGGFEVRKLDFEVERVDGFRNKAVEGLMIELLSGLKKGDVDAKSEGVLVRDVSSVVGSSVQGGEVSVRSDGGEEIERLQKDCKEWKCEFEKVRKEYEELKRDCDRWKGECGEIRKVAEDRCMELVECKGRVGGLEGQVAEREMSVRGLGEVVVVLKGELERLKKEGGVDQKVLEAFIQERDALKVHSFLLINKLMKNALFQN